MISIDVISKDESTFESTSHDAMTRALLSDRPASSLLLIAVIIVTALSGCDYLPFGGDVHEPEYGPHQPPAVGTRFIIEERRHDPALGPDTTLRRELETFYLEYWQGEPDVFQFIEKDPPAGPDFLSFFRTVEYYSNGDIRNHPVILGDSIESCQFPFGEGHRNLRGESIGTMSHTRNVDDPTRVLTSVHRSIYEGEVPVDVDGVSYTARVVRDSMYLRDRVTYESTGPIYLITLHYVPEIGFLPYVRFERWSVDDAGVARELVASHTFTLLRIEE